MEHFVGRKSIPEADAKRILDTPVGHTVDKYIWAYNDNGAYSVKSGSWLIANCPLIVVAVPSPLQLCRLKLKQRVWKIKAPPKIKMFIWRILASSLAVSERLASRGLNIPQVCRICNLGVESINHVLCHCPNAMDFWRLTQVQVSTPVFGNSLELKMERVFDMMDSVTAADQIHAMIPWFLWQIWNNRNALLLANTQLSIHTLVQYTLVEAKCWQELNKSEGDNSVHLVSTRIHESKWQKPMQGQVKCNISSNWTNTELHCGGALTIRDHTGSVLMHAREAFTKSHNRITAEFLCMIWAIQNLQDLRFKNVVLMSDCKVINEALRKPQDWPRYRVYTEHIQRLKGGFDCCSFEREAPKANLVAQEIAKSVTRDGRFNSYLSIGGPAWLHGLIRHDAT